jgi:hypothetical protein
MVVEPKPVDVTTHRTAPQRSLMTPPSAIIVTVNGGVLCIFSSWRRPRAKKRVIPNRWLSALRPVGHRSKKGGRGLLPAGSPSTSGSGNMWEKSTGPPVWHRLRWADRPKPTAREMCGDFFHKFPHRGLDSDRFIDGFVWSNSIQQSAVSFQYCGGKSPPLEPPRRQGRQGRQEGVGDAGTTAGQRELGKERALNLQYTTFWGREFVICSVSGGEMGRCRGGGYDDEKLRRA